MYLFGKGAHSGSKDSHALSRTKKSGARRRKEWCKGIDTYDLPDISEVGGE